MNLEFSQAERIQNLESDVKLLKQEIQLMRKRRHFHPEEQQICIEVT
jgi:hypothetical protein